MKIGRENSKDCQTIRRGSESASEFTPGASQESMKQVPKPALIRLHLTALAVQAGVLSAISVLIARTLGSSNLAALCDRNPEAHPATTQAIIHLPSTPTNYQTTTLLCSADSTWSYRSLIESTETAQTCLKNSASAKRTLIR